MVLQKGHHTLGGGREILDGGLGQWREHCSDEYKYLMPVIIFVGQIKHNMSKVEW